MNDDELVIRGGWLTSAVQSSHVEVLRGGTPLGGAGGRFVTAEISGIGWTLTVEGMLATELRAQVGMPVDIVLGHVDLGGRPGHAIREIRLA